MPYHPEPTSIELESVEALFGVYPGLRADLRERLVTLFRDLRALTIRVLEGTGPDMHEGAMVLLGMLSHTNLWLLGAVQQLTQGNGALWSACIRGLMEAFGAIALVTETPDRIVAFVDRGVKAGKLRAAAERARPGLGGDIDRLSRIVHPGDRAVFAPYTAINDAKRHAVFIYGPSQFPTAETQEGGIVVVNIGDLIVDAVRSLLDRHPDVLGKGKIFMQKLRDNEVSFDP